MRALTGTLAANLASHATTLCRLCDITLLSGAVYYFTDSDRDVTYAGNVYASRFGCNISQTRNTLGTEVENVSVDVILDAAAITSAMVETGMLDAATIRVLAVDFTGPDSSAVIFVGQVTQCDFEDGLTVSMSAQSALARNTTLASDVFCSNCRADLGDAKCKVNLDTYKAVTTVAGVTSRQQFSVTAAVAASLNKWQAGLAVFTSGVLKGQSFEIAGNAAAGLVTLRGLMPLVPTPGDGVTLYPGCDKTIATCQTKYANIANFRGEPFAVAPWIATADQPYSSKSGSTDSGSTSGSGVDLSVSAANKLPLYMYCVQPSAYTGPQFLWVGVPVTTNSQTLPRLPEWGSERNVWAYVTKMSQYQQGVQTDETDYINALYNAGPGDVLFIASDVANGAMYTAIPSGNPRYIQYYNRVQLSDTQLAKVYAKWPSTPTIVSQA